LLTLEENWGRKMATRKCVKHLLTGLSGVLLAVAVAAYAQAACKKVPLGPSKDAYYAAMAKRMSAAHGIGMKRLLQKGNYAGSGFAIVWYRFGTDKEIEDATGISISDDPAPGAVTSLLFLGNHSPSNMARIQTLAAASVSYFAHVDEAEVVPEIDAMLKKMIAAEPTKEDVLQHRWKPSVKPVAEHQWGNVHIDMTAEPTIMDTIGMKLSGLSCQ
jgi:hypothetical protein